MVNVTDWEVALSVPGVPYMPPVPGVPGLVTVSDTVPAVARALSGIVAINCLAVTNMVGCCVPFQPTVAFAAKLLPLTVKVSPVVPAGTLSGESSEIVGATPGCGAVGVFEPYPPHPVQMTANNNTERILMTFSFGSAIAQ